MSPHDIIIEKIKEAIKSKIKPERISKGEFKYKLLNNKEEYKIDLLVQLGDTLHIFECKTGYKLEKAKKQLKFHKSSLLNKKVNIPLIWGGDLSPFSKIQAYFVSEEYNIIIKIDTNEEIVFDPIFLEDPIPFLNR